jgi:hypothetical protein
MDTLLVKWIEFAITLGGLFWAIFEYYRRQKIEKVLKTIMKSYPGDVAKIEQSCVWAWANAENALKNIGKLPDSSEKQEIIFLLSRATSDATASARMCAILFNQLLTFQQAQFDSREITHSEQDILDLCKAEVRSKLAQQ